MTLDDRVKAVVTEMLAAGAPSITAVHTALVTEYDYEHSYKHFYEDFRKEDFKTPEGFGKRGRRKKRDITPALAVRIQEMLDSGKYKSVMKVYNEIKQEGLYSFCDKTFYTAFKERGFKTPEGFGKRGRKKERLHEQRQEALQTLCAVIISHYIQRALQEDKPKGYAAACYYSVQRKQMNVSLEKLEGFFEDYFAAQEGNVTKTLEELAKKQGFGTMTAQRVLKKVGLKPLGKDVISSVEKDALQRAASVAMGIIDIAYFMNTDYPFTVSYTKPYRVQRKERFGFQIGCATTKQWIGYRHASKVYQALQEGFTPEEAQILADIHPKAYDFIMQNRTTFEPIIIAALQKMYNQPTHNVPYVTVELHRHLKSN